MPYSSRGGTSTASSTTVPFARTNPISGSCSIASAPVLAVGSSGGAVALAAGSGDALDCAGAVAVAVAVVTGSPSSDEPPQAAAAPSAQASISNRRRCTPRS